MKAFDLIPIQRVENNNENDNLVGSFPSEKTYAVPTQ